MDVGKVANKTWKIVEKASIPLLFVVISWALTTILSIQNRIIRMEEKVKEDEAQWRILQTHTKDLQDQKIEVEVYKRMFEMLLDRNQLKIERISLPEVSKDPKKTYEEFRREQMMRQKK